MHDRDPRLGLFAGSDVEVAPLREILQVLDRTSLEIRIAGDLTESRDVRTAVSRGADLLSRLFSRVAICAAGGVRVSWIDAENAERICVGDRTAGILRTVSIGIGDVSADVSIGIRGSSAIVSRTGPACVAPATIGALIAGPIMAAEAFKEAFSGRIPSIVMRDYVLDPIAFGFEHDTAAPTIDLFDRVDIALLGCGSIGYGVVDTILRLPRISGRLILIDNGTLEGRNIYKYPLLSRAVAESKQQKVIALRDLLERYHPGLRLELRDATVSDLASIPTRVAIASVDNISARRDCQELLTRDLINVAMVGTTIEVASLRFGETGCVGCLYAETPEQDYDAIAEITGLSATVVGEMWKTNSGLTAEHLHTLASRPVFNGIPLESFVDQPLSSVMQRLPYAETAVVASTGRAVPVSTAFVSAMAGSLALIEALKLASPASPYRLRDRLEWDMLGTFTPRGIVRVNRRIDCPLCGSLDRIDFYNEQWSSQSLAH